VLVFAGGESRPPTGGLICVDPKTGAVDFEYPHRSRTFESVNASAPLVIDRNRVFISECYGAGGAMLEVGADFKAKETWKNGKLGTHFMTAIHKDGFLYGFDGHGPLNCPLVCLDAKTGEEKWRQDPVWIEQIDTPQGPRQRRLGLHRSQLLHFPADGRTLCLTEWGHLLWLDLNPTGYKELGKTMLFFAGETWTPPVVSRGLLYVNQNSKDMAMGTPTRIICYDLRGG
jgi:outer membrane protein assembly factor BamB